MRLVAFEQADGPHIGVVTERGVVDLSRLDPAAPRDLGTVIKTGQLDQIAEGPFDKQPFPAIFMRSATSLVAANQPIIAPAVVLAP